MPRSLTLNAQRLTLNALPLVIIAAALVTLDRIGSYPSSDSGGYENMLRHFLATGSVDYMRWSQPTFVGLLPAAAVWSSAFGASSTSLALLISVHALLLVVGAVVFASEFVKPGIAALIAFALVCAPTFVSESARFMTDIPFCCYLVWFLVVHRRLERLAEGDDPPRTNAALWTLWAALLLVTALVRSFALILVPALILQAVSQRTASARFSRTAALLSLPVIALFVLVVKLLTRNGFSLTELTILKPLLIQHDYARFDLRAMAIAWFQTGFALAPALLLLPPGDRRSVTVGRAIVATALLLIGFRFWRRALLPAAIYPPWLPASEHAFALITLLIGVAGILGAIELLRRSISTRRSRTAELLVVLVATHFLILPIMNHPLTRHVFPGYVALLMLLCMAGATAKPGVLAAATSRGCRAGALSPAGATGKPGMVAAATVSMLLIGIFNYTQFRAELKAGAIQWNLAQELVRSGVSPAEIDAGWGWFCKYDLVPGTPNPGDYVEAYHKLFNSARYKIDFEPNLKPDLAAGAHVLRTVTVPSSVPPQQILVLDRTLPADNK